jgi:hypothetical protein
MSWDDAGSRSFFRALSSWSATPILTRFSRRLFAHRFPEWQEPGS